MNDPTFPLSWNTLPIGANVHLAAVTSLEDRSPRHGPVIDMTRIGRIVLAGPSRTIGTAESIVINALARGYEVYISSPITWRRGYRTKTSSLRPRHGSRTGWLRTRPTKGDEMR